MVVIRLKGRAAARRRGRRAPIALEQLEDRCLPSTGPMAPLAPDIKMAPTYVVQHHRPGISPMDGPSGYGFSPTQLLTAYTTNQVIFQSGGKGITGDGTGQTIAIVDAYDDPNAKDDLAAFSTAWGLPAANFTKIGFDGNGNASQTFFPPPDTGWAVEMSLDIEWAHAIAPAAKIVLLEALGADLNDLVTAVQYAGTKVGAQVVSMSWGGQDFAGEQSYDALFNVPGVTFVASSGDYGNVEHPNGGPIWPSVSGNVVAAGGTTLTLNTDASWKSEIGWGYPAPSGFFEGSGGGVSQFEPAPAYQKGLQIYSGDAPANGMRAVPDIAYDSDPKTGVPIYDTFGQNGWMEIGGTSAAAPQLAAVLAIADQGRGLHGVGPLTGPTDTLPDLYNAPSTAYHDITGGTNGYPAGPGYDEVTGIGTPIVSQLMPALGAPLAQQVLTTVSISPTNPTVGDGGQLQFSATGYDQFGYPMVPQPSLSWQLLSGQGSIDSASGQYTAPPTGTGTAQVEVTASENGVTVTKTTNVNYEPGPAITGPTASPNPTGSTTTTLSAGLADPYGNLSYNWSVVSGPSGAKTPTLQPASGTATPPTTISSTATFFQAGTYVFELTASDTQNVTATSDVRVTVSQTFTSVAISPASAFVDDGAQQQFTAIADDQFGNPLVNQPSIAWSVATGSHGTIDSTGMYTAPSVGSGTDTVQATTIVNGTTLTGTASVTYSTGLAINAFSADPNPVEMGNGTTLTAQISDTNASEIYFTLNVIQSPAGASYEISPQSGYLNTGTLTSTAMLYTLGTYVIELDVSDYTGQTASAQVTVNVISGGLQITSISADPNPVTSGNTTTLTAQVVDPSQSFVNYFWTAVTVPPGAPQPEISPQSGMTSVGTLTASATFFAAGTYVFELDVSDFSGQSTSDTLTVNVTSPGLAITSLIANPNPVPGTTTTLTAQVTDSFWPSFNYSWSVLSGPAGVQPPTISPQNGMAAPGTLNATATFFGPGTYQFQLYANDPSGASVTDTVTVQVITPGPTITSLSADPNPVVGAVGSLDAKVTDGYYSSVSYTWSVQNSPAGVPPPTLNPQTGSAPTGALNTTCTYYAPGNYTFKLSVSDDGGQSSSKTVSLSVVGATPTINLTANPSTVTGTTTTLSGAVTDANETSPSFQYTWSVVSAPPGATSPTFADPSGQTTSNPVSTLTTFYAAGAYKLQLSITDTWSVTANQTVNVTVAQTLTSVTVTPASASILVGSTQQFNAQAFDQFNQALTPPPSFNWIVASGPGTINSSGLYTGTAVGTATVKAVATVNGVTQSGSAQVTVTAPAPVINDIHASPNPVTGTTTTLSVSATDPSGGTLSYSWSVLNKPSGAPSPSISAPSSAVSGVTFYAAGTYQFQVVVTSNKTGASTPGTVTVTVQQTLTRVTVKPSLASVPRGATLQLSAAAYDQFLNPMTATFNWLLVSGPGSVDANGLYTAPTTTTGKAVVKASATVNGVTQSGSATILVT
jgi:hypothetical protein